MARPQRGLFAQRPLAGQARRHDEAADGLQLALDVVLFDDATKGA
jgi:hypothetical protein